MDYEETVATMAWDIERGYRQAQDAMIEAKDVSELMIAFGRKQALEELYNMYVTRRGV